MIEEHSFGPVINYVQRHQRQPRRPRELPRGLGKARRPLRGSGTSKENVQVVRWDTGSLSVTADTALRVSHCSDKVLFGEMERILKTDSWLRSSWAWRHREPSPRWGGPGCSHPRGIRQHQGWQHHGFRNNLLQREKEQFILKSITT